MIVSIQFLLVNAKKMFICNINNFLLDKEVFINISFQKSKYIFPGYIYLHNIHTYYLPYIFLINPKDIYDIYRYIYMYTYSCIFIVNPKKDIVCKLFHIYMYNIIHICICL
jgi:hypothetical protein